MVDPPARGVTSRSRKRGSLAGASESRSRGERDGGLAPPSPLVGEPHPEETIEAPELRSLRSPAKQDELLPQREVLEREVSAGSERRTERAQQNEYQGHCLPGSHAVWRSSCLCDRILANDSRASALDEL